jgi:proline iminopeptidase
MDVPGRLIEVRGTRLHVYEHGDPAAPALLYVHGGPGQGAYDFVHHQGDLLADAGVHLVAVDQRGSLFSDPLRDGEQVTETGTVADLEAVRETLGIDRWSVLGQSFGGRIALRYAVQHPDRVSGAIFENPAWDYSRSGVTQVEAAVAILERMGADTGSAQALLAQPEPITTAQRLAVIESLGDHGPQLWFHQAEHQRPMPSERLPSEVSDRGNAPGAQLLAHEQLAEPLTRLLPELGMPVMLLLGLHDCVTDDDTIELFNADVDLGEVVWFEESGHFCHVEEPQTYARVVGEFVART